MCGIAGVIHLDKTKVVETYHLRQMLASIRHRGPDEFGIYQDRFVGLGSARLSIIDLATGQQPIPNEDCSCWIILNGEIFNYIELRQDLEARGHHFTTASDTEVILHLYEEYGVDCLKRLNGQFAFAIWDSRQQRLFCGRDRLGIRPLFYTVQNNTLVFGSEIKAILSHPQAHAELDIHSLEQVFTFWATLSPKTVFKDIYEVPPAHYLIVQDGNIEIERYWDLEFTGATSAYQPYSDAEPYTEELLDLLVDATRIRLRADVPVGAYVSGGLDSSIIASIIRNYTDNDLKTFSITFENTDFDESNYQQQMVDRIGTDHHIVEINDKIIGDIFPKIVWHAETALLRTAPAPMYLLSGLVHQNDYKVVMTGEGADEFFGGYNIFKETMVRHFWSKNPDSTIRPLLFEKLYPYLAQSSRNKSFFQAFFRQNLSDTHLHHYSHMLRWKNTSRVKRFLSSDIQTAQDVDVSIANALSQIHFPDNFATLHPLEKAQYLEVVTFMSQYLLSSQGDRMGMGNSVEGRYPFLDHRVVEYANQLPPNIKLRNLNEKYLLKQIGKRWLPDSITKRAKNPYRAPIFQSFFGDNAPDYVKDILSPSQLQQVGIFEPKAIQQLEKKIARGMMLSETDNMAVCGIISTQLLHQQFIQNFHQPAPITEDDKLKVVAGDTHP